MNNKSKLCMCAAICIHFHGSYGTSRAHRIYYIVGVIYSIAGMHGFPTRIQVSPSYHVQRIPSILQRTLNQFYCISDCLVVTQLVILSRTHTLKGFSEILILMAIIRTGHQYQIGGRPTLSNPVNQQFGQATALFAKNNF